MASGTESPLADFFGDHLRELRRRVLVVFGAVVAFTAIAYYFSKPLTYYLVRPILAVSPEIRGLVYTHLTEAFVGYLKIAVMVGVVGALPVACYETWMFVSPGLKKGEKRTALKVTFWGTLLFTGGAVFAYFIAIPEILAFLVGSAGGNLQARPRFDSYLTFIVRTVISFGLAFEVPFLMVVAGRTGLVPRRHFVEKRWISYVVILVVSFMLVAGDLVGAVLLAVPFIGLYEAGIVMMALFGRRKERVTTE